MVFKSIDEHISVQYVTGMSALLHTYFEHYSLNINNTCDKYKGSSAYKTAE